MANPLTHRDKCASAKDCGFWWCADQNYCFGKAAPKIKLPAGKSNTITHLGKPQLVPSRKSKILAKTGGLCWLCEGELKDEDYTVDHIRPISRGGTGRLDNLMPAHQKCNQLKGNLLIQSSEEFKRLFPDINQLRLNLEKYTQR